MLKPKRVIKAFSWMRTEMQKQVIGPVTLTTPIALCRVRKNWELEQRDGIISLLLHRNALNPPLL